jgi:hypothetical protein
VKNSQPGQGTWCICFALVTLSATADHIPQPKTATNAQAKKKHTGTINGSIALTKGYNSSNTAIYLWESNLYL